MIELYLVGCAVSFVVNIIIMIYFLKDDPYYDTPMLPMCLLVCIMSSPVWIILYPFMIAVVLTDKLIRKLQ